MGQGLYIQLVANDKYHVKDVPLVESVYFHVIPDAASRAAAFESGKVDLVPGGAVEYFDVLRLSKLPGAAVTTKGWEFLRRIRGCGSTTARRRWTSSSSARP